MNDSEQNLICKKNLDKKHYFFAEKSSGKDDNTKLFFAKIIYISDNKTPKKYSHLKKTVIYISIYMLNIFEITAEFDQKQYIC